jgi:tetratricopeptide (TPR) repeat protein
MAKAAKQQETKDFFATLTKGIERFISEHLKILIICIAVAVVGLAAYFITDYLFDRREKSANSAFGKVYLSYREISESNGSEGFDESEGFVESDEEAVNEKLLSLNEDFKKVIEAYPNTYAASESAYFIGDTLYKSGRYDEAVEFFKQGYSIKLKSYIAILCLFGEASCHEQQENYSMAESAYKRIIDEYKDSFIVPLTKYNLGQLYEKQDKYTLAEREYSQIVIQYEWSSWKELAEKRLLIIKGFI